MNELILVLLKGVGYIIGAIIWGGIIGGFIGAAIGSANLVIGWFQ